MDFAFHLGQAHVYSHGLRWSISSGRWLGVRIFLLRLETLIPVKQFCLLAGMFQMLFLLGQRVLHVLFLAVRFRSAGIFWHFRPILPSHLSWNNRIVSSLFFQCVNLLLQNNPSLPQNFHLAFGCHSLRLLVQSDGVGYALARFTCFHERSEFVVDLGDFFLQWL